MPPSAEVVNESMKTEVTNMVKSKESVAHLLSQKDQRDIINKFGLVSPLLLFL